MHLRLPTKLLLSYHKQTKGRQIYPWIWRLTWMIKEEEKDKKLRGKGYSILFNLKNIFWMQTNQETEAIKERFAVYAPENISLVTIANLSLLPSQSWKLENSQKVDSLGRFISASKCIKFPLWKVKIQASSSLCARKNVFLLMKCFSFPLTKEPLDVIGAVQGMEVYCDIHSSGFGNWKICRMGSAADPKAKF